MLSSLPAVNASLNALCSVLLVAGWVFIRAKRVAAHRACMAAAFACSIAFLVSYLVYHYHVGSVRYTGPWRPLYLAILASHTVLAAFVPFLALRTLWLAWRASADGDFSRHAALARVTLPIWLYVSVTGVVIYAFLYG